MTLRHTLWKKKQEAMHRSTLCRCDAICDTIRVQSWGPHPRPNHGTYIRQPACRVKPLKCDSLTGRRTRRSNAVSTVTKASGEFVLKSWLVL